MGWDAPVVRKVRDYLIPSAPQQPVDLRSTLVLVPTRHAGRRLREALTLYCAEHNTYLLAPALRTPFQLVRPGSDDATANPMDVSAVWAHLLRNTDMLQFPGLFPSGTPARDFHWALQTGAMLQSLRDELAEHGESIRSVLALHGEELEERDRWGDLERLESLFVSRLTARFGRLDPCDEMLRAVSAPHLPDSVDRIILACNPDPTPVALRALNALSASTDIVVLVHAPDSLVDDFDAWGRPIPARWRDAFIDIPEADVILASAPSAQSSLALEVIDREDWSPADIALGVPDTAIAPYLESSLSERGVATYDPAGIPFSRHPVFQLLQVYHDLLTTGSYLAFSSLLRNADILDYLNRAHGVSARELLTQLDQFQNLHLPGSLQDLSDRLGATRDEANGDQYPALAAALSALEKLVHGVQGDIPEGRLRSFLRAIYSIRELHTETPEDQEFRTVADRVDETLRLLSDGCLPLLDLTIHEVIEVMLLHLGSSRYTLERSSQSVDLEGWLELPWNDAPLLMVTGMNDGSVPQRPGNEAFLPDSLRRQLGLRTEDDRLTRDVFLARTLVESRRGVGHVCFITGKFGQDGEPLRPSRLLTRCRDEDLPGRAQRLFGAPDDTRPSVPSRISFTLRPSIPTASDASIRVPARLAVTAFRDYLNCPFRFYLKRVLGMEPLTDTKREMDALDFGTLVHDALARMAAESELRNCTSAATLRRFLHDRVDDWARARFGPNPPLHLTMQLDVARDRLSAAARVQAEEAAQGWEILMSEQAVETIAGSIRVNGRIDRVDRHRHSGMFRILDYKTSDVAKPPEDLHVAAVREDTREYARIELAGRERRWTDLQLPLYVRMLRPLLDEGATIESGYFNLPRETDSSGVVTWQGLTGLVLGRADECAAGIIADIEAHRFWPPAKKVQYEEFESLFPAEAADCIDGVAFTQFLEAWRK